MAIGDTLNQNPFGTNYNAEEEERKKAELAAQNARIGAGNVPASAFGQAPAVAPFSMEAAGRVNPMMQPQNLESFAQPQVTFRDYDVPATPPASALSVFTPGGEVKPNVDVNAITPSPETTSTSAVNTALNQEVPVGSPENNDPSFMSRLGSFLNPSGAISGGAGLPPTFTPPSAGATQAQEGTDITPVTLESLGLESAGQKALKESLGQPSSNIDPFTGKTIEKPTPFDSGVSSSNGMTMNQKAIMDALGDQNQGMGMNQQAIANAQGQEVAQVQAPTAPTGGLTTVGGASLSEFLSGQAMPEQGFTQEESPLSGRGVTLTQDQMNQLSAEREARLDARLPGDQSVSDRDRRAARGDGISMADQVDMAKANARGATPREVARGNQVANALGLDLKTGQPPEATGGLTFDQQLALRKQNFAEGKFDYELAKDAQATYTAGIEASQKATTEEAQADTAGRTMVSAISNMNDAMTRMGGRSGEFFGGGFFGKAASFMPGTSAYDQVADVEFLQSNVALNAMSELKELSPTGSTGFGALSEKELRVLTDKYANLNPFTSPGLFQSNLKQLQGEFNNMLDNAWNKHSKEYSPEAANAIYGNRGGSGATGAPSQAVPNDRNVASAADTLLSDPKYN